MAKGKGKTDYFAFFLGMFHASRAPLRALLDLRGLEVKLNPVFGLDFCFRIFLAFARLRPSLQFERRTACTGSPSLLPSLQESAFHTWSERIPSIRRIL
jgi:hypothetical protein